MSKLKKLLDLIEKGIIETDEELKLFYEKADFVTDKYGEFEITNMQFLLCEKLIYVNVTDMILEEEYNMEALVKNLPLEIQNPDDFSIEDFDELIRTELKNMYIRSLGSSVTYSLLIDYSKGKLWKKETIGTEIINADEEDIFIHSENNAFGDDLAWELYTNYYLFYNELEDTEENFDEFIKEYVETADFENYATAIIENFHENLEN